MLLQQTKLRVSEGMGWVQVDHHGWLRPDASEGDAVVFEMEPFGARYRVKAPDGRYLDVGDGGRVGLRAGHHAECTLGPSRGGEGRPLRIDGAPLEVGVRGSKVYFRLRDDDGGGDGEGQDGAGCITVVEPKVSEGFSLVTESVFFQMLMQEIDRKGAIDYDHFDRLSELAAELVGHIYQQARGRGLGSPSVRRDVWSWMVQTLAEADVVLPARVETVSSQLLAEAQSRLR